VPTGGATSRERGDAPRRWRPPRRVEFALATGIAVLGALAALLQLFWGQDIGLADNGDGFRLMCHFDLVRPKSAG
jgi:hypothetical protein